ncbi:MAG: EamA family transporter [Deltaproteobacteria bacterium]|nr:EamA family transporter [Deltaproteobacteria bacterium]
MVYIKLLLTAFFWGGTFVAGRIVARDVGPFSAAFLRFAIASLFLVIFLRREKGGLPRLNRLDIVSIVLLGLTGIFAYNVLFLTGLKTVTASRASLIIATNPIFISLAAHYIFREKLTLLNWLGVLLCAAGAALVISRGDVFTLVRGGIGLGELFLIGCVASWVFYALIGKMTMERLSPMAVVTYSSIAGALMLLPFALFEGIIPEFTTWAAIDWYAIAYLGFCGTVLGFTWFYEGMKKIGASRAAIFINFVPVCAVIMAWVILNEKPDISLITGAVLVISGAYLTNRKADNCRRN